MTNDALHDLMQQCIEMSDKITFAQALVNKDKRQLAVLEAQLAEQLEHSKLDAIKVSGYTAKMEERVGMKPLDWQKIWAYIMDTRATHLLQKRLIQSALEEMHENGDTLPGAELRTYKKLSIRKG